MIFAVFWLECILNYACVWCMCIRRRIWAVSLSSRKDSSCENVALIQMAVKVRVLFLYYYCGSVYVECRCAVAYTAKISRNSVSKHLMRRLFFLAGALLQSKFLLDLQNQVFTVAVSWWLHHKHCHWCYRRPQKLWKLDGGHAPSEGNCCLWRGLAPSPVMGAQGVTLKM